LNTETLLSRAREAALAAGARQVDCFHRSSRSRILTLESGRSEWSERREEGMAVRAWGREGGQAGMAAMATGGDPDELGRQAAALSGARPQVTRPDGPLEDAVPPEEAHEKQETGDAAAMMAPVVADIFDPEFLRSSRGDLERRLTELARATGITRRAGLPTVTRATLRLATLDRQLLTRDGIWQSQRSTLASLRLRFPSAFGLSTVEIASRHLAGLGTAPLVPWLAAHPGPVDRMKRYRARPAAQGDAQGDAVLTLAPPVMASLLTSVAARVAAGGRPMIWNATAVLRDDPSIPWGPGTIPLDGEGRGTRRIMLAGPAPDPDAGEPEPVKLSSLRMSYREPPRPLPTNLILEGLPAGGAAAAAARFHLLDVVARHGGWLLVRAVERGQDDHDQPVLMEIPARLEALLTPEATGGPSQPFLVGEAFVSCPAVTVPGWQVLGPG
jgi:hypothetical protein